MCHIGHRKVSGILDWQKDSTQYLPAIPPGHSSSPPLGSGSSRPNYLSSAQQVDWAPSEDWAPSKSPARPRAAPVQPCFALPQLLAALGSLGPPAGAVELATSQLQVPPSQLVPGSTARTAHLRKIPGALPLPPKTPPCHPPPHHPPPRALQQATTLPLHQNRRPPQGVALRIQPPTPPRYGPHADRSERVPALPAVAEGVPRICR